MRRHVTSGRKPSDFRLCCVAFVGMLVRETSLVMALVAPLTIGGCSGVGKVARSAIGGEPVVRLLNDHPQNLDLTNAHTAPADKIIGLEVEFAMRNQQQFDELMGQISDPQSPEYHHWLNPAQMHTRFGETHVEFEAVLQWLQTQAFTITDQSYGTNADYIRFTGSVRQIEKAFDIELVQPEYDHYAANNDPAVPARFQGVISRIVGLEVAGPLY